MTQKLVLSIHNAKFSLPFSFIRHKLSFPEIINVYSDTATVLVASGKLFYIYNMAGE